MIKVRIVTLGLALTACFVLQAQPAYGGYSIVEEGIFPSTITPQDSVIVPFEIYYSGTGAQKKFAGTLTQSGDTIVYTGCYYCGCFESFWYIEPDTVKISPLPVGLYHLIIVARYAASYKDTFCVNSSPALYDTIDTFFTVSQVNAIETPVSVPFYAYLEAFNVLQINAGISGTLSIDVYDELGRRVFRNNRIAVQQGNNSVDLQMPALSSGIYFYLLNIGDKERVLKYVKQ